MTTRRHHRWARLASSLLVGLLCASACGGSQSSSERPNDDPLESISAEELYRRGAILAEAGDYTRAEQYLAASIQRGYPEERGLPLLLQVCIEASRLVAALTYAQPYLAHHPDEWSLRLLVASIHMGLGDHGDAVEQLERVVEDAPEQAAPAHYFLGVLYRDELDNADRAADHFRNYLALAPEGDHREEARASLSPQERGLPQRIDPEDVPPSPDAPPSDTPPANSSPPDAPPSNPSPSTSPAASQPESEVCALIPKEVFEQTLLKFFGPIKPFLDDASVSEVMINGPDQIFVERAGKLYLTDARFPSRDSLTAALRNLAQFVGRHVDEHRPILEGRLPDGSRVEAVLPPAAPDGPMVAIRRFAKDTLTIDRLLGFGSFTPAAAQLLEAIVAVKQNIIVAGGTGSGKTSMLNALTGFIPSDERIVIIEDTREVQCQQEHVVQLESRTADARGKGIVTIRDLFKATLRMRPDRIVVGEIRGAEALDLVQAMTSGHGGCLSTVHATYPTDTMNRLETMAMMSDVQMPLRALRAQVASAIDFIVQTSRLRDGSRCVTHITEVKSYDPDKGYDLANVFERRYEGQDEQGRIQSRFAATGYVPKVTELLQGHGYELPDEIYTAGVA